MDRDAMIAQVQRLYDARIAGGTPDLTDVVAPGAPFRFNGEDEMTKSFPGGDAGNIEGALDGLNQRLKMVSCSLKEAVAQDQKLASIWEGEFYFDGHDSFKADLFNLWTFDQAGLIASGIEFFDTALLIRKMLEAGQS